MRITHYLTVLPVLLATATAVAAPVDDAPFQALKSYDFQSRAPVYAIDKMIREAGDDGGTRAQIEAKLLADLADPATTYAAQEEIGRLLREVGTARSVPALAKWLTDDKLNNVARYALERIADPAAGKALRDAVPMAKGMALVGIVNSIGNRGDESAVPLLKPLASSPDTAVAHAAIVALGKTGTREAAAVLQALPVKSPVVYQALLTDANLMLPKRTNTPGVWAIYRQIMGDKTIATGTRLAATRGLLVADPVHAVPLLLDLLRGDDTEQRALAVKFVREMPSGRDIDALTAALPQLPPAGQAPLLAALADRGNVRLLPALMRASTATDPDVRLAALHGFATVPGTAGAALALAKTAATATNNADRDAARSSLAAMRGVVVDQAILAAIPGADPALRAELVMSLGRRYNETAKPTILGLTADPSPVVQGAAMNALGELAGPDDYPALVKLLEETKSDTVRGGAEGLVLRLSHQVPNDDMRTGALIAGLNGVSLETRAELLKVLGAIGGPAAINAIKTNLKDPDTGVQEAALRALAGAPDTSVMPDLLDIAKTDPNKVHQVLALRGYLRLADTLATQPNANPKLDTYEPAIKLATEPQEKQSIISGLTRIKTPESLALVSGMIDDEAVRNEAAQAAISIAKDIAAKNPTEAKAALNKVTATVKDANIVNQANDVLKGIKA